MSFINNIISESLINALGWTLVHSLWQGAAAAVGLALVMIFMRKYRSQTRYYIGVMTIILVLAMAVVTFVSIYTGEAAGAVIAGQSPGTAALITGTVEMEESGSILVFFKHYFNRHLPLLVTAWLLGILVLVLRFAGGFIYNQRVKVYRTRPLSKTWQNRLEAICRGIGIQKSVQLVESALVKMPMTIGHLKPVILFPLGLVTGLPRDQVEALLAHELAHISRRDYLVNIVQNLVDIIFFYHPGVRWISSHVRAERENCCDDIAVSVSGDSLNFAKALTNIQVTGHGLKHIEPAVAASGKRYGLLARVKRLLSPPALGSRFAEGFIGASILAVCLLTLVVSANAAAAMNRDMVDMQKDTAVVESRAADDEEIKAKEEAEKKRELEERWNKLKAEKMELEEQAAKILAMEEDLRNSKKEPTKEQMKKMQALKEGMKKRKYKIQQLTERLEIQKQEMFAHMEDREKIVRKNMEKMLVTFKKKRMELKRQQEDFKKVEQKMRKEGKELSKAEKEKFKQLEIELKQRELELKEKEVLIREEITRMREQGRAMRTQEREMRAQEKEMRGQERQLRTEERQKRKKEEQFVKQKLEKMRDEMKKRKVMAKELEKKIQNAIEKKIEEKKIAKLKEELDKQNHVLKKKEELYKLYIVKVKERQKELDKKRVLLKEFESELVRDKLVVKGNDFEFKLGKKGLYINGVKQPKKVFKKYLKLYKKLTGNELSDSGFQIVLNGRV